MTNLKMNWATKVGSYFALALLAVACGGGGGSKSTPPAGGSGSVTGFVMDLGTGVGVSAATVSGGGTSGTTDAKGYFTLTNIPQGSVTLTVTKTGYAPAYATPRSSDKPESTLVSLKKQGTPQAYSPAAAQTLSQITEAGPYAVTFAANSLDTTATNLTVSITPVDPTKEAQVLPGSLTLANQGVLTPVTFAEFSILDSAGNRVQLKAGQTATVELPIPPSLRSQYPLNTTIHCYAFDPTAGAWNDFVDGTVVTSSVDASTPVLKAAIRHFSWYGGAPVGNDCNLVYGKVVSAVDGTPLGNARVEATPGGVTYTDANGNFVVPAKAGGGVDFTAYQTGFDVSGALTGTPGAKYIEFGRLDDIPLTGLTLVPCASPPASATAPPGTLGGPDNPVAVKVGLATKAYYEVTAILSGATTGNNGSVLVTVQSGLPDANGNLQSPVAVSGSIITVTGGSGSVKLVEVAAGSGLYSLPSASTFVIQAGQTYKLDIDADGNGSIDGSGSASVVGDLAWTSPTSGGTYPAATFAASWTDTGITQAAAGYSAVYYVSISNQTASDAAYYVGTAPQFTPYDLLQGVGSTLPPGTYQASLAAFSGFNPSSSGNITVAKNITGVGLSGTAYSFGTVTPDPISFTLQ